MLGDNVEVTAKATRRVPWPAVLTLVGTLVLTIGLVLIPFDASRFGSASYGALFVLMLLTNATVVLPAPGLAAAIQAAKTMNPILVGLVSGLAAGLGETTGWLAGRSGGALARLDERTIGKRIRRYVEHWGVLTVFVLAAIPSPLLDVAGLAAGTLGMPWWKFVVACIAGKTARFTILAYATQAFFSAG